jgi:soluble lytic murein transglycosylase-like protein
VTPSRAAVVGLAVILISVTEAAASSYRLVESDGTVHLTNAPNDPRYKRLGLSGTQAALLRLPIAELPRYAAEIQEAATQYGVPRRLIEEVIRAESAFNASAVSPKGARGLMQLMPATASMLGVRNSFDPRENIRGGVRHLRALMDRYGSNLSLTLAAYNAGEHAVNAYGGVPPYPETQQYVRKILAAYGGAAGGASGIYSQAVYQWVDRDGTVTFTNIPPGRLPRP